MLFVTHEHLQYNTDRIPQRQHFLRNTRHSNTTLGEITIKHIHTNTNTSQLGRDSTQGQ